MESFLSRVTWDTPWSMEIMQAKRRVDHSRASLAPAQIQTSPLRRWRKERADSHDLATNLDLVPVLRSTGTLHFASARHSRVTTLHPFGPVRLHSLLPPSLLHGRSLEHAIGRLEAFLFTRIMASRHVHGACRLGAVAPSGRRGAKCAIIIIIISISINFFFLIFAQTPLVCGSSFPRFSLPLFRTMCLSLLPLVCCKESMEQVVPRTAPSTRATANCGSSLAAVPLNTTCID